MQRKARLLVLTGVFLWMMSFVGCFAFVKSDRFGSWEQFLMKYTVGQYYDSLARELVDKYRPEQPATEYYDGKAHLWCVSPDRMFYSARWIYLEDKFGGMYLEEPFSKVIGEERKGFITFVVRSMTPDRVRGLVKFLPELVSRMIEVAQHPRSAYSDGQIREMLLLYALEANEAAQYCSFVMDLEPEKDGVIGILEMFDRCSSRGDDRACSLYTTFGKELQKMAAKRWKKKTQDFHMSTLLWVLRRRQDGGNRLLQAYVDLAGDIENYLRQEADKL